MRCSTQTRQLLLRWRGGCYPGDSLTHSCARRTLPHSCNALGLWSVSNPAPVRVRPLPPVVVCCIQTQYIPVCVQNSCILFSLVGSLLAASSSAAAPSNLQVCQIATCISPDLTAWKPEVLDGSMCVCVSVSNSSLPVALSICRSDDSDRYSGVFLCAYMFMSPDFIMSSWMAGCMCWLHLGVQMTHRRMHVALT